MLLRAYIRSLVRRYLRSLPVKVDVMIFFGSTVYGERLRDSDIDLIVVSEDFEGVPFERRMLLFHKFWRHRVPLEAFGFTHGELEILRHRSIIVQEALEKGKG